MKLTVLDMYRATGQTITLAQHADALGCERFWMTEHQPQPSPTLLTSIVAASTERIRVGTAGLLMRHHAPPRAAYDFQLLSRAFGGRIDAGVCAGHIPAALNADFAPDRDAEQPSDLYERNVELFCAYLRGEGVAQWADADGSSRPFILGGSPRSATLAAIEGAAYGYSLFLENAVDDTSPVMQYKDEFRSRGFNDSPCTVIAVAGVCADTEAEARTIVARHTNPYVVPRVVGNPEQCVEMLRALGQRYRTDEVAFMDVCHSLDQRLDCYELLAAQLVPAQDGSPERELS